MDELVNKFGLEERVYRFRCVETWSMVVPWIGFPLKKLIDEVQPLLMRSTYEGSLFLGRGAKEAAMVCLAVLRGPSNG